MSIEAVCISFNLIMIIILILGFLNVVIQMLYQIIIGLLTKQSHPLLPAIYKIN